ncbi:hypothetical protein E2C01_063564 [Portunus trituberculatus]|uniref:Uncharacterized protein n=1 Tax=Portunus trituberculatus TaxID=210409 RepID=A0A5B7H9H2_PORTR|nr:hypothetical protein [Portunus trituberculatus]
MSSQKVSAKKHTFLDTRPTDHSSSGYYSYPLPHTNSHSANSVYSSLGTCHVGETMMVGIKARAKHVATIRNE